MPKLHPLPGKWRDVVFAGIALLVVVADQLSKWWISKWWETANPPDGILWNAGFFRIIRVQNTGAAFGIFQGHPLVFTVFDFIGIAVFLVLVLVLRRRWPFLDRMPVRTGIGLVLGGTIGNLIDRLRLGQVTDYFDFKVWPTFNVADACITVGVIVLIFCIIFLSRSPGKRV
jgi:signal peptidase II